MSEEGYVEAGSIQSANYEDDMMKLCRLKVEDFRLLGYADFSAEDVWACVRQMTKGKTTLSQTVAAIMSLQVGQLMNFLTMNAFKGILD